MDRAATRFAVRFLENSMSLIRLAAAAAAAALLAACSPPAEPPVAETPVVEEATAPVAQDVVETARANGSFTTLVAAVEAAGLAEALKGAGPFTVFAPTDDAFKKLPAGTVEDLLKPENKDKLAAILKYHVVASSIPSSAVTAATEVDTLEGGKLAVAPVDGGVKVGEATVVTPDVAASNGVIHVIDTVLLPPAK
jgi:uncharacterized surface protein with fasciclin (FAS1) repeats